MSDYDSSTIRRRFIGKSNGRLPSFPIVCLISNRSRAPRRILRVSMKLAINILMHERGSFGARARAGLYVTKHRGPSDLCPLIRKNRIGLGSNLFFGFSAVVTARLIHSELSAPLGVRSSALPPSIFALCAPGQQTVAATEGRPRMSCLPAYLPFPFTPPLHPSLSCGIWESMPARSRPRSAINLGVVGERDDKSVRSPRFRA